LALPAKSRSIQRVWKSTFSTFRKFLAFCRKKEISAFCF
jgi:hypothetical protein